MKSGDQSPITSHFPITRPSWESNPSISTIISSSGASEWRGAQFAELDFARAGKFHCSISGLIILCPLESASIKKAGRGWRRREPARTELELTGEDSFGAWEGEHRARLLSVTEEFIETFASSLIEKITLEIPTTKVHGFTLTHSPRITHLMTLLHADVSAGSPDGPSLGEQLIVRVLNNVFPEKHKHTVRTRAGLALPEINKLRDLIHSQIGSRLSLKDLAHSSGMSSRHMCRIFRAEMGLSPHAYIMRCRVEHASALITKGKLSLAEIASICGFSNPAHMTVTFRKILGVPPSDLVRSSSRAQVR
jgi:AraC-like DNA-binding protein